MPASSQEHEKVQKCGREHAIDHEDAKFWASVLIADVGGRRVTQPSPCQTRTRRSYVIVDMPFCRALLCRRGPGPHSCKESERQRGRETREGSFYSDCRGRAIKLFSSGGQDVQGSTEFFDCSCQSGIFRQVTPLQRSNYTPHTYVILQLLYSNMSYTRSLHFALAYTHPARRLFVYKVLPG